MKQIIILIAFLSLVGCTSTKYVLYELSSNDVKYVADSYYYENNEIKIDYNFWHKDGLMEFKLTNNSEKPIFIDWKKSSFIINGIKFNYWNEQEMTYSAGAVSDVNYLTSGNQYLKSSGASVKRSVSITTKVERITFIPPNSSIIVKKFFLTDGLINNKNLYFVEKDTLIGGKELKFSDCHIPVSNSIGHFKNYITYSFQENFEKESKFENNFNIIRSMIMDEDTFLESKYAKIEKTSAFTEKHYTKRVKFINDRFKQRNRFYITFEIKR